ncbi:MAG: hypothetical protein IJ527_03510 [Prevotella sp.]|nr:hypothetical protein [Prevotella sp.]
MTDTQYTEMVSMLTQATQARKLTWDFNEQNGEFLAKLGDCEVHISSSIDFEMQTDYIMLKLYNANGAQFDSFSGNEVMSPEQYAPLATLYEEVRNSYYKIRESEETIITELQKLTAGH